MSDDTTGSSRKNHYQRAFAFYQLRRYADAERELGLELAINPDNARAHALLSFTLHDAKRFDEALREATYAVSMQPDLAYAHRALSYALAAKRKAKDAEQSAREALKLEPDGAWHYAWLANILGWKRRWRESLAIAEQGLKQDPEHAGCAQARALALRRLGRKSESREAVDQQLGRTPDDARAHFEKASMLMEQGSIAEAIAHFKTALRIDPTYEAARRGLVDALRARNPVYRTILRYTLWVQTLRIAPRNLRLLAMILVYVIFQDSSQRSQMIRNIFTLVLLGAIMIKALIAPLFNLLLRMDPIGRMALNAEEIVESNFVGIALLMAAAGTATAIATHSIGAICMAVAGGITAFVVPDTFRRTGVSKPNVHFITLLMIGAAVMDIVAAAYPHQIAGAIVSFVACTAFAVSWVRAVRRLAR